MEINSKFFHVVYSEVLPSISKALGEEQEKIMGLSNETYAELMELRRKEIKKIVNIYIEEQLTIFKKMRS